ncbi:MAG: hypothetical protein ACJ77K_08130 [Bacteroidia bacterium]|jgi:hypothetical protein
MRRTKKYNTKAKRMAVVKRKAMILTFKEPFWWKGEQFKQIYTEGLEKSKGAVKVIGFTRDTPWYKSMDELLAAIDWDLMEDWHRDE